MARTFVFLGEQQKEVYQRNKENGIQHDHNTWTGIWGNKFVGVIE